MFTIPVIPFLIALILTIIAGVRPAYVPLWIAVLVTILGLLVMTWGRGAG